MNENSQKVAPQLPLFKVFMAPPDNLNESILSTLHSGYITQGKKVEEYEKALQEYFQHPYILSLNSATSGLTLAIHSLNIKKNKYIPCRKYNSSADEYDDRDEILCCPLTCFATTSAILTNKHIKIVWVDVDKNTGNMDLEDLKRKITKNSRAILVVFWGGTPCDLNKLYSIAKYHDLTVIEDCAHSFGALYEYNPFNSNNRENIFIKKVGGYDPTDDFDKISVFSTQAIKHLTTVDGGFICLPNKELYDRIKLLRWYGISREKDDTGCVGDFRLDNNIKESGYKFHMNDVNATIGLCNLPFVDDNIKHARLIAQYYNETLVDVPGVILLSTDLKSAYWLYTIRIIERDNFIRYMHDNNIMVSQVHSRNDKHSCVQKFEVSLPNLDLLEKSLVCIPIGWWVTLTDAKYVVDCIKEWCAKHFCVRLLSIGDKNQYLNLLNQMYLFSSSPRGDTYKIDLSDEEWKNKFELISTQDCYVYVVEKYEENDLYEIIGTIKVYIEYTFGDSLAHIENVIIDSKYRNRGYGSFFLQYVTSLHADSYKIVANSKQKKYFEQNNFIQEGEHYVYRYR